MSDDRRGCDALGCPESYPLQHELLGEPSFGLGKWLGWLYLDLNRPDLAMRELGFCSVNCCTWWLEREQVTRRPLTELDKVLRRLRPVEAR